MCNCFFSKAIELHTIIGKRNRVDIICHTKIWFIAVSFIHLLNAARVCSSASYTQTAHKAKLTNQLMQYTFQKNNKRLENTHGVILVW